MELVYVYWGSLLSTFTDNNGYFTNCPRGNRYF
ncbi:MAG: hypothetical protein E3J87_10015 [Candidatus Cloacimonadota bacterium]|nr:MAG: hypothetical protein E3J87_10015 [Candidatus Cloacimonadota bacterium]